MIAVILILAMWIAAIIGHILAFYKAAKYFELALVIWGLGIGFGLSGLVVEIWGK